MIAQLHGIIIEKTPPEIVLDVGGVGYEIQLPMTSFFQLPDIKHPTTLFIHHIVREDAQLLFGFTEKKQRSVFRVLIKANGIGPKLACTILSGMTAENVVHAVVNGDVSALVKMPGVGKKTAERLVLELKDKVSDIDMGSSVSSKLMPAEQSNSFTEDDVSAVDEAISALIALGYKKSQAEQSVKQVIKLDKSCSDSSETIIRLALKSML